MDTENEQGFIEVLLGESLPDNKKDRALPSVFYTSQQVFELEKSSIFKRVWHPAGHISMLPETGCYLTYDIFGESLLLVRTDSVTIRAFANVCLHRGAPVCITSKGKCKKFTCPYHGWTYELNGKLINTRNQSVRSENSNLTELEVVLWNGVIFSAPEGGKQALQAELNSLEEIFSIHGIREARTVCKETLKAKVNWKLFVENFLECYHCLINHPELTSVEAHIEQMEKADSLNYFRDRSNFITSMNSLAYPHTDDQHISTKVTTWGIINSHPIGNNRLCETQDGSPVTVPMGKIKSHYGGFNYGSVGPFLHTTICSDYAVLFRFLPQEFDSTVVDIIWLVNETSPTLSNEQIEKLKWLWFTTIQQDIAITEKVQKNLSSQYYSASPYVFTEYESMNFIKWYYSQLEASKQG